MAGEWDDESRNVTKEWLAEDPSVLDEDELREIAKTFGISMIRIKAMAREMSKDRAGVDPNEV